MMLKQQILMALFSMALASSMAVPAFAEQTIPSQQAALDAEPAVQYVSVPAADFPLAADENPLTRAELISVLYEQEGRPGVNFAMNYTDVSPDAEYAQAIRWASGEGIAGGYGNGSFGPEHAVTREQLAVILYRHAQSHGQGFTGSWAFPLRYEDAGDVSEFAYEAVCWMTMKNVMGDCGDHRFIPKGEVTHQEAKSILGRYFQAVEKPEIANPFWTCKTMNEAAQIAGFSLKLPDMPSNFADSLVIRAVESSMIEVLSEGEWGQLTVRKGIGTKDISGDHSVYSETRTEEVNDCTVTLKGNGGRIMMATWSNDGYAYAVRSTAGLDHDAVISMVSNIR